MTKSFIWAEILLSAFIPLAARAACGRGYFMVDGECTRCPGAYYCPGDDTIVPCPEDTSDWPAIFTAQGYENISIFDASIGSWQPITGGAPYSIQHCYTSVYTKTSVGTFLLQTNFAGPGPTYDANRDKLWYQAATGYYLSGYNWTSYETWYYGVKACTNAPDHAHYTGPGTPDEPKTGGATDYNDCPWACDEGYGAHNGACAPLCTSGVSHIKTSNGLQFNLYPIAYSTPRLAVQHNSIICYGILRPGADADSVNINYGGAIYHMEN